MMYMGDFPERDPQLDFRENRIISILKFYFCQINVYDLQKREVELRKIIFQKYRFYKPFSRGGILEEVILVRGSFNK